MAAGLEPEAKAGGRLCKMRHSIGTEVRGYIEGRTAIDQTPVLGPDEESASQFEVCAAAIDERCAGLGRSACKVCRRESQTTHAGFNEGRNSSHGHAEYVRSAPFMLIRGHPRRPRLEIIARGAPRVAIIGFYAVMLAEEEPVTSKNTTAIGAGLANTVLVRALDKRFKKLRRHFGPSAFVL